MTNLTNQEAIEKMKGVKRFVQWKTSPEYEYVPAINMAIKALESQSCEDCISRKAILDYLDKMPSELTSDGRRVVRRITLEEYISNMPSVQPYRFGKWVKTEGEINTIGDWGKVYKCSCCNKTTQYPEKFCPNCGAEMGEIEK